MKSIINPPTLFFHEAVFENIDDAIDEAMEVVYDSGWVCPMPIVMHDVSTGWIQLLVILIAKDLKDV